MWIVKISGKEQLSLTFTCMQGEQITCHPTVNRRVISIMSRIRLCVLLFISEKHLHAFWSNSNIFVAERSKMLLNNSNILMLDNIMFPTLNIIIKWNIITTIYV